MSVNSRLTRALIRLMPIVLVSGAVCGCGGNAAGPSTGVTPPVGGACNVTLSADQTRQTVAAEGGTVAMSVQAASGCTWTVEALSTSFLTVAGDRVRTGAGEVTITVAPNKGGDRSGTLSVAEVTVTITQQAAPCLFALSGDTSRTFVASGGVGRVIVDLTQGAGCEWTASTDAAFITIQGSGRGTGQGSISFDVSANTSAQTRTGSIRIADTVVTVTQVGIVPPAQCGYVRTPPSQSVGVTGGSFTITLDQSSGPPGNCAWSAAAPSWVTLTLSQGSGSATLMYSVAANASSSERAGTIDITWSGGSTRIQLTQAGNVAPVECAYARTPSSNIIGQAGGTYIFTLGQSSGTLGSCTWTATAPPWVTLIPSRGSGSGMVEYLVAANTASGERIGSIDIAWAGGSIQIQLTQSGTTAAACTYGVQAAGTSFGAVGGLGTIGVIAPDGCHWRPLAGVPWITTSACTTFPGGLCGGTGSFAYTIAPNDSAQPRTGDLTVAGQTVTVTQAGKLNVSCAYFLDPQSQAVPAGGGSFRLRVVQSAGTALECRWSLAGPGHVTLFTDGGWGSVDPVPYNVAQNPTTSPRDASISLAWAGGSSVLQLSQAAGPAASSCNYTVNPTAQNVPTAGGEYSFTVTRTSGTTCYFTFDLVNSPSCVGIQRRAQVFHP